LEVAGQVSSLKLNFDGTQKLSLIRGQSETTMSDEELKELRSMVWPIGRSNV